MSVVLGIFVGSIIGLVLGLTGAGGSVFAVPLLILLLNLPIHDAIGIGLGAVAFSAVYGSVMNLRRQTILWTPALLLASSGVLFAPAGKWLGSFVPNNYLTIGFSALAIYIAIRMWRQAIKAPDDTKIVRAGKITPQSYAAPVCRLSPTGYFEWKFRCVSSLLVSGIGVGLLTGFFGVGGGFLIVPLLIFLSQVAMQQAVATSLFIIAMVSTSGFASYLLTNEEIPLSLFAQASAGGVLGMLLGQILGRKIAGPRLQQIFAASLILLSVITIWQIQLNL